MVDDNSAMSDDTSLQTAPALSAEDEVRLAKTGLAEVLPTLTNTQRRYVNARIEGMSKAAAARYAGIKHAGNYHRLDNHPKVRAALSAASRIVASKLEITREDAVQGIMDALPMADSATEQIMAWREIAKLLGHYAPEKVEVNVNKRDLTAERMASMPTAQLMKMLDADTAPALSAEHEEAIDAEYEVLSASLEVPKPIDYDSDPDKDT